MPFGADDAERIYEHGQLVISYHSRGPSSANILRVKESYIPPYYTIDRLGFSGFSELALNPTSFLEEIERFPLEQAQNLVNEIKQQLIEKNLSKYSQPQSVQGYLPDDYIFIPLQTVGDPVADLSQLDQLDVAQAAAEFAASIGKDIVIKRHPLCRSEQVEVALTHLERDFSNVHVVDHSIHSLIEKAFCVMGCNSGVLCEALVHGAHVITFGGSDFQIATRSISHPDDIPAAVLGSSEVDHSFRLRFLAWYLSSYCVRADDVEAIQNHIGIALSQLDVLPKDANARQLEKFNECAQRERERRNRVLAEYRTSRNDVI
ncbi:hypothetical protein B5T_01757 [Alloalcanivorax dieselolei B5]|uniref:Capsule polysaccharide biosynthesis protein n=1 Tax=Alcanivorax dieselolei (strain DSM 16502 / CGMCC 1.3690 / MCCC 1A00001 / B-5) TaxID=930169 RepID=K0C939_ALCDB|nr:hypothetical protein B5T_01757 [Alloalcanivorax dieselolei B5]